MGFTGFSDEAFEFYEGLQADNTKTYWTAHRETYETAVRGPMMALFEELEPEFGPGKIFRPYRDVRFSSDKSPYKTAQGGHTEGGFYLQIDADRLLVAAGMYGPAPDQLERFRGAVDSDASGKALAAIIEKLRAAEFDIEGDRLKTRPRGTPPDHPRLELLRHRSLYGAQGWPPEQWMHTAAVTERVRDAWRQLRPLIEWVAENVGPSTQSR